MKKLFNSDGEELIYLCETENFTYYGVGIDYDEITMARNNEEFKTFGVSAFVDNALAEDIENGKILKVAPDYIESYLEILKSDK